MNAPTVVHRPTIASSDPYPVSGTDADRAAWMRRNYPREVHNGRGGPAIEKELTVLRKELAWLRGEVNSAYIAFTRVDRRVIATETKAKELIANSNDGVRQWRKLRARTDSIERKAASLETGVSIAQTTNGELLSRIEKMTTVQSATQKRISAFDRLLIMKGK